MNCDTDAMHAFSHPTMINANFVYRQLHKYSYLFTLLVNCVLTAHNKRICYVTLRFIRSEDRPGCQNLRLSSDLQRCFESDTTVDGVCS